MLIKINFLYSNQTKFIFNILTKNENWRNGFFKNNAVQIRKCLTQLSILRSQNSLNYKLMRLNNFTKIDGISSKLSNSSFTDESAYDQIADDTMDTLSDKLEMYLDKIDNKTYDIMFNNGVITLFLCDHGTYVINKQTPNRQIWLSSPVSGPKRYDYIDGNWIYKYDGQSLNDLLKLELEQMFTVKLDL